MFFWINLIFWSIVLIAFIIWKRKLIKDLWKNRKEKKIRDGLILLFCITVIGFFAAVGGISELLENTVPFKTYDDYLFWNEYIQVTGRAELEEGLAYGVGEDAFTAFLTEENGKIVSHEVHLMESKYLKDENGFGILGLWLYQIEDVEKYIIISFDMTSEENCELSINDIDAVEYNDDMKMKINILEEINQIKVIFNGQEYVLDF